jgi:cytochrome c
MLQKAVDHYNSVGREQALSDFNHKKAPFGDRDLYVVCIGPHDKLTANGGFPQYVGLSPDILKDAEGKPLGKSIWETGNSKGEGSVEYPMTNPVSRKIERKITFVRKIGDDVCGVGAYNP